MAEMPARVNVQLTRKLERSHEIKEGSTIGRDGNCSVQVLAPAVSRFHARFSVEDGVYQVHDLGSENGTYVNGGRIEQCRLDEGDTIRVGPVEMIFQRTERMVRESNILRLGKVKLDDKKIRSLCLLSDFGLVFDSSREMVDMACHACETAIRSYGWDMEQEEKFLTAVREAINNAQRHGNGGDASKEIRVLIFQDDDKVTFSVVDEGGGFDFLAELERSQEGSALDAARARFQVGAVGGLGIRLMLKCVDRLRYGGEGSRIHLTKFKKKREAPLHVHEDEILTKEEEAFMRHNLGKA